MLLVLATVAALSTRAPIVAAPASTQSIASRTLTLNDRIAAQHAIEEVYWRHRIWPKDNPSPKPSLDTLMPASAIRAKVEDYLKKSNALEGWWHRPITGEQLQAELDRMARGSHDPKVLQELFDALHSDAYLIAETLARPILVERLARNWFANDEQIHGSTRVRAEAAVAACHDVTCMKDMGGTYSQTTEKLRRDGDTASPGVRQDMVLGLDAEQWKQQLARWASRFDASPNSIPTGRVTSLETTADAFAVSAVLSRTDGELVTATTSWAKESFDTWWKLESAKQATDVPPAARAFSLPALDTAGCANDTWSPTFADVPDPRYAHTAVWTGTEMIVWGGYHDGPLLNSGGRYNPATDTWTPTSSGPYIPPAAVNHTVVWTGTEMIVWGGWNVDSTTGINQIANTGARYDPANDTWAPTSTGANVPAARWLHAAVWTGTEMIVWGGIGFPEPNSAGGRYNPVTDTWMATAIDANTPARGAGPAIWTGSEMIVWGTPGNQGARYNSATDSWAPTSTGANVPSPRGGYTAVWTGTEMIVWGGDSTNTGGRYNPATDSWVPTSTGANVPSPRYGHTAVWTGSKMIVWGGSDVSARAGATYDPATDSWVTVAATPLAPASLHTAIWTGDEMIVWGGMVGSYAVNTGARFNPNTNSWVATSVASIVPAGRLAHTAIWTGTEMIVWGGQLGGSPPMTPGLNSGGRYTPATDSWVPTSLAAPAPDSRTLHTAVWTGTEMIVWGGYSVGGRVNTGNRYNPTTDRWAATSTGANVPPGLEDSKAVWTGREMIVWGLTPSSVRTGARYDPATDTWRAMSTGPVVPAPSFQSPNVWTGQEMLVWGAGPDPGGRYNPSTDSWTPISTGANAPVFRWEYSVAWTGTEMLVWGGCCSPQTGGRYSPSTDSWMPTSTGANVPSARDLATAVWTGSEMIIWGGGSMSETNPAIIGGRYQPTTDSWLPISVRPNAPSPVPIFHTAVWTGTEMIVWGGLPGTATGGRYCACPAGQLVYRDADGDGLGDPGASIGSCDGSAPVGYVLDHTDCNDAIANMQSDFDNDGEADACDLNDGLIYEWRSDKTSVSWQAEQGPTSWNVYIGDLDVLRATGEYTQAPGSNAIAAHECGITGTVAPDTAVPEPGKVVFSLVTGVTNGVEGSLGSSSSGTRPNSNPCPN